MTYGFRPENWPAFQAELQKRGIAVSDLERVELRPKAVHAAPWGVPGATGAQPPATAVRTIVEVTVTLRSGRSESWTQPQPEST